MRRSLTVAAVLVLFCVVWAQSALCTVTATSLKASPAVYRGDCPGVIKFNGTITSDRAGIVRYIFTRSDGATDTNLNTLRFLRRGTMKVQTTWTLGGSTLCYYTGWEAIKVLSPNAVESNKAKFELKCNPPLNSAISAHGNTDWHIDTANEFLFGTDMGGTVTAPNHAPAGWTKRHMHNGATNTSKYYYDKTKIATGEDNNAASGIDRAMLFFYAGHGCPTFWNTLGDNASQPNMLLANIKDGGMLRYYWQCSCAVFAHGPNSTCGGSTMHYSCPQDFDGSADSAAMRNVFERWGPALTSDLRMACGMSTSAYCHESNVDSVWSNYNNLHMGVAESFIEGFGDWGVVPLCITKGGADITKTPLYTDATFTNQPNTSGSTYYHIMYASGTQSQRAPLTLLPVTLPRLRVVPITPSARFKHQASLTDESFAGGKAIVNIESASGAVLLKAQQPEPDDMRTIPEKEYLSKADAFVKKMGWHNEEVGQPKITRLATASIPAEGGSKQIVRGQKTVVVTYQRRINVRGTPVEVLGAGGKIKLAMNNKGRVLNATQVWRKVEQTSGEIKLKTLEQAKAEAARKLSSPDAYVLDQWRWGYKEPAGNVAATELKPVFQFAFVPKDQTKTVEFPPRIVEITAER